MQTETQSTEKRLVGVIRKVILGGGYGFIAGPDDTSYHLQVKDVTPRDAFRYGVRVEFTPLRNETPGKLDYAIKVIPVQ